MTRAFLFLALLSPASFLRAQPAALSGPLQGYVFDPPTRSIRGVIGSLGSATLGPSVVREIEFGSVSPGRDFAIVVRSRKAILVQGLDSDNPTTTGLPDFPSVPEGVAWSSDGSAALLYSRTGAWIQALSGLPTSVQSTAPVSLAPYGGTLSTVAVASQGLIAAIGMTGDHPGVYAVADGGLVPLLDMSRPVALAFSQDGGTLYAVDADTPQVFQTGVSSNGLAGSAPVTWPLPLNDAIALQPAPDASNRQVLYVAGRSDQLLLAYDARTHEGVAQISLPVEPSAIQPLGGNGFLLRPRVSGDDPLWSFTTAPNLAVYFVPGATVPEGPVRRSGVRTR